MAVQKSKYRITQGDANVALTAGTIGKESTVATFTCPDRTAFQITPEDIFSLYLASTTPTELSGTSQVKLIVEDPNGISSFLLALIDYTVVTEWKDRLKLYTIGQGVKIKPQDRLKVKVTGNLAADTDSTRFQLSATRVAETLY